MLDTSNEYEPTHHGDRSVYEKSDTVTTIKDDLVKRYMAGSRKYGLFIDQAVPPTEQTGERHFAEMVYNEVLDAATYALKAKRQYEDLQSNYDKLYSYFQQLVKGSRELKADNHSLYEQNVSLHNSLQRAESRLSDALERYTESQRAVTALEAESKRLRDQLAALTNQPNETRPPTIDNPDSLETDFDDFDALIDEYASDLLNHSNGVE